MPIEDAPVGTFYEDGNGNLSIKLSDLKTEDGQRYFKSQYYAYSEFAKSEKKWLVDNEMEERFEWCKVITEPLKIRW